MVGGALAKHLSRFPELDITGTYNSAVPKPMHPIRYVNFDCLDCKKNSFIDEFFDFEYVIVCTMAAFNSGEHTDSDVGKLYAINSFFPRFIADFLRTSGTAKILNISSDAVYSGLQLDKPYSEFNFPDPKCLYGMSKFLGEVDAFNVLNVRTSFVGRDPRGLKGLFNYVGNSSPCAILSGYYDYMWSGVTTLQFCKLIEHIIFCDMFDDIRALTHVVNYTCNKALSKYELLKLIVLALGRDDIRIDPVSNPQGSFNRAFVSIYDFFSTLNNTQSDLLTSIKDMVNE